MKKYKLGEIAEIEISGVDKKTKEGEIPVKLCNFVDVYHNWAITKDLYDEFMDASARQSEIDIYKLKKGQVAFTKDSETRDDIGIPTYIADNFDDVILGYHTALVTPNREFLNGKYLNAFMNSRYIQKYFEFNASGSGQRYTLSNDTLNNIPILAPDLNTQSKIGELFSSLDKKIALNSRINARLEQMAKRLYEHYFVQFDFPTADGKPYKTSGGKMVYSSELKREIPEGWEVKSIKSVMDCDISGDWGQDIQKGNYDYKVNCIRGCDITDMTSLPQRFILTVNSKKLLEENDFVIEISGGSPTQSTGRIIQITREILDRFNNKLICSNFCRGIRLSNKNYVSYFNYMWKMFYQNDVFFNYEGKTSGLKNFQFDTFVNEKWYFPDEKLVKQFNEVFFQIKKEIDKNELESARLTSLRDRLLPLLMNGQVSV